VNPLDECATDLTGAVVAFAQSVEAATLKTHHESVIEGLTKDAEAAKVEHNQMKAQLLVLGLAVNTAKTKVARLQATESNFQRASVENALLIKRNKGLTGEFVNERPALFSSQTQLKSPAATCTHPAEALLLKTQHSSAITGLKKDIETAHVKHN
jgi:hypothetical protein